MASNKLRSKILTKMHQNFQNKKLFKTYKLIEKSKHIYKVIKNELKIKKSIIKLVFN